jgi:predicted lipid-binding transport protein (Tim44 family)
MHFLIGLGILAGLVWFAFGAGVARAIVGVVLLAILAIAVFVLVREDRIADRDAAERVAYEAAAPERASKAKAAAEAEAATAAAEVDRKSKEEKNTAAAYSATFFANLETARKRPLYRASWVPFCRDFNSRGLDRVSGSYGFGGIYSTADRAALVAKDGCEMAANEALTQEGVASIVFNCQNFNDSVRQDAIKADAVGGAGADAHLVTMAMFCKVVASFTNKVIKDADEANQADAAARAEGLAFAKTAKAAQCKSVHCDWTAETLRCTEARVQRGSDHEKAGVYCSTAARAALSYLGLTEQGGN